MLARRLGPTPNELAILISQSVIMALMLDDLRHNRLSKLSLDRRNSIYLSKETICELREALVVNTSLTEVNLSDTVLGDSLVPVIEALSGLPIQSLRIYSSHHQLNVSVLAQVIQRCTSLRSLNLTRALTVRHNDDVACLASALTCHPSLQDIAIMDLKISGDGGKMSLDPLLSALATLSLETIDLTLSSTPSNLQRISDSALQKLFMVPQLQDITLWHLGLDDQHVKSCLNVLQHHKALKFLSLRSNPITDDGWNAFADMLLFNYTLVSVYSDATIYESAIQVLLYLNQRGRGRLFQDDFCGSDDFMEFASELDDVQTLYCFVRSDPVRVISS